FLANGGDRFDHGSRVCTLSGRECTQMGAPHAPRADDRNAHRIAARHGGERNALLTVVPLSRQPVRMVVRSPSMRLGVVLEAFLDRTLDDTLDFVARGAPQITDLELGVGGFAPTPHCDVAVAARPDRPATLDR